MRTIGIFLSLILISGGVAFAATGDNKATPLMQVSLSEQDLEIIRDLDFLENFPLLSEEDFNMLEEAEEPVIESAQK